MPWLCSVRTRSESPPLFAQNEGSSLPCSGSCLIAATGLARGGSVITCRRCWQCGRRLLAGAAPGPRSDGEKQACHHRERNARRVRRGARPDCGLSRTGIRSVRHQCGFGHRSKHTTCRSAKNKFPQPGMPVPAHDNEVGTCIGCI